MSRRAAEDELSPMRPCRRFVGKVAIVTGGGSGIGRATAIRLAGEGAKVFVAGRRLDNLEGTHNEIRREEIDGACLAVDLRDRSTAARVVDATLSWAGRLDAL